MEILGVACFVISWYGLNSKYYIPPATKWLCRLGVLFSLSVFISIITKQFMPNQFAKFVYTLTSDLMVWIVIAMALLFITELILHFKNQ